MSFLNYYPTPVPAYTGLGDITAFTMWYGLRAYSAAFAAGAGAVADLRRSSDNATMTAHVLTNGDLDTATISAWAGASSIFVSRLYDQVGTRHIINGTNSDQPQLILSGAGTNSRPYTERVGTGGGLSVGSFTPATGACSLSVVGYKNKTSGVSNNTLFGPTASTRISISSPANTTNQWRLISNAGGGITATALEAAFHYSQGVIASGTNASNLRIDGTNTVGTITLSNTAGNIQYGISGTGITTRMCEAGAIDNVTWSSTIQDALDANQAAYYGL
jgi:hypothetical protein